VATQVRCPPKISRLPLLFFTRLRPGFRSSRPEFFFYPTEAWLRGAPHPTRALAISSFPLLKKFSPTCGPSSTLLGVFAFFPPYLPPFPLLPPLSSWPFPFRNLHPPPPVPVFVPCRSSSSSLSSVCFGAFSRLFLLVLHLPHLSLQSGGVHSNMEDNCPSRGATSPPPLPPPPCLLFQAFQPSGNSQ